MSRRHALLDFYRAPHSPYHLNVPKKRAEGVDQAVERYGDRYKTGTQQKRPQLSKVLYLDPKYFPSELYSTQQQRLSAKNQGADAQAAFFKDQGSKQGVSRLEQLAKMESKLKESGDAAEAEKKGGRGQAEEGEQDDDDAVLEEYEEEDDFIEDDDYYQGNHFDDDEGYDDPYDDGDDGPIF